MICAYCYRVIQAEDDISVRLLHERCVCMACFHKQVDGEPEMTPDQLDELLRRLEVRV